MTTLASWNAKLLQLRSNTCRELEVSFLRDEFGVGRTIQLAAALQGNTSLEELYLSDDCIGNEGAQVLAEALQRNCTLRELVLTRNRFELGAGIFKLASSVLSGNSALTRLDLSGNDLRDEGVCVIADCLRGNKSLTDLVLRNVNLECEGAAALASALRSNGPLTSLDLFLNRGLLLEGVSALAKALQENNILRRLDLSDIPIGDAGARALGEALAHNTSLAWLNLSHCEIEHGGFMSLSLALRHNHTLAELKLRDNRISVETAEHFFETLAFSDTNIKALDLGGNHLGWYTMRQLLFTLAHAATFRRACRREGVVLLYCWEQLKPHHSSKSSHAPRLPESGTFAARGKGLSILPREIVFHILLFIVPQLRGIPMMKSVAPPDHPPILVKGFEMDPEESEFPMKRRLSVVASEHSELGEPPEKRTRA